MSGMHLYLTRNFIYRKMALQWDPTCHVPSGIAMYRFDLRALSYTPKVLYWKSFRDDIFAVWNHSLQELHKFFEFMNSIDTYGKIKFTLSVANSNSTLEFLDLSLQTSQ